MPEGATNRNPLDDVAELAAEALRRVQRASQIAPRLLDIDDAGRYLGMSDKAVRHLISSGQLRYIQRVPARSPYLIDRLDLDRWIEQHKSQAI